MGDEEFLTPETFRVEAVNPEQVFQHIKTQQASIDKGENPALFSSDFPLSETRLNSRLFEREETNAIVIPTTPNSAQLSITSQLQFSEHEEAQPSRGYFLDEEVSKIIEYLKEKGISSKIRNIEGSHNLSVIMGNGVLIDLDLGYKSSEDYSKKIQPAIKGNNPIFKQAVYKTVNRESERNFANPGVSLTLYKDNGEEEPTNFPLQNEGDTASVIKTYATGYQSILEGIYKAKNAPLPAQPILLAAPPPNKRPVSRN